MDFSPAFTSRCLQALVIVLVVTASVQCQMIDVLKIDNVPFPQVHFGIYSATTSAPYHTNISEYTVCYRYLLDSYNDAMGVILAALEDADCFPICGRFSVQDRLSWKDSPLAGADGYQGGALIIGRNIPGGGIGGLQCPGHNSYVFAKDIQTSKWNHICYAYSPILHRHHMYQDGLKVFGFTFPDETEDLLGKNHFRNIYLMNNIRGLFADLQIFASYFDEEAMISWTTKCNNQVGEIFQWDKSKLNITQVGCIFKRF